MTGPRELLDAADVLMAGRSVNGGPSWQRACAGLIRVALEQVLDGYWQHRAPSVARTRSTRTKLLVLRVLAGEEAAARARAAWNGLCRAMHHHSYELPPTSAELRAWHAEVAALLTQLEQPIGNQAIAIRTLPCG